MGERAGDKTEPKVATRTGGFDFRFALLRFVGLGQVLSGTLSLFLLVANGLVLSTLVSITIAGLLTAISLFFFAGRSSGGRRQRRK